MVLERQHTRLRPLHEARRIPVTAFTLHILKRIGPRTIKFFHALSARRLRDSRRRTRFFSLKTIFDKSHFEITLYMVSVELTLSDAPRDIAGGDIRRRGRMAARRGSCSSCRRFNSRSRKASYMLLRYRLRRNSKNSAVEASSAGKTHIDATFSRCSGCY